MWFYVKEMRHKQKVMRRWRIVVDFVVIFTFFLMLFSSNFSWTPMYYIGNKHISNMITLSSFGGLSLQTVHNTTEWVHFMLHLDFFLNNSIVNYYSVTSTLLKLNFVSVFILNCRSCVHSFWATVSPHNLKIK